jgi:D-alanine-D-alanine ligase
MNIAVLAGGDSSEFQISVKSGKEIQKWLEKAGLTSYLVIVQGNSWTVKNGETEHALDMNTFGFSEGKKKTRFDYVWNVIHGTPGEDGKVQGYLDLMGIPYSCSGLLSSALTFDKSVSKAYLKQFGVLTAEWSLLKRDEEYNIEEIIESVGLPCFVKPNRGGSSFGTTKVSQTDNLEAAIEAALTEDTEVIIESYIKGSEVTCGLLKTNQDELVFPLTEIVPKTEFFDYEAKYKGLSEEITPARIDTELAKKCQALASDIYDHTQSRGIVRIDFIIKGNQLYFLELNSIPGMTKESIVPQQIRAMGLKVETVLQKVIEESN